MSRKLQRGIARAAMHRHKMRKVSKALSALWRPIYAEESEKSQAWHKKNAKLFAHPRRERIAGNTKPRWMRRRSKA